MSSYNNVTKIKYTGNLSDLVSLNEYIIFQDDKAKRKYIVFKFTNNVTQQLLGMEFEVCQYNAENNLIEKSVVIYNKFLAGAEEDFVPKAKLRVSYHCTTISVRLIKAAYDRFVWNEGEYEDNSYKFDHFFHDEQSAGDEEEDDGKRRRRRVKSEETGGDEENPKKHKRKKKQKRSKHPFVMKDATRRNFSRFPTFFNVIACVAVIAFVMMTVLIFKNDTKKFTQGDYQYRVINEATKTNPGEIAVCGYVGSGTVLTVPSKWDKYNVTKVDKGAFSGSKLTEITFRSDVLIDTGAFVNCKSLTQIKTEFTVEFKEGAFNGCTSLNKNGIPEYAMINCG